MGRGVHRTASLSTKKTPTRKSPARKSTRKAASPAKPRPVAKPRKKPEPVAAAPDAVWQIAVRAAEDKKAADIKVLDLRTMTSFTDYLIICTGTNPRQIQAISDEVEFKLKEAGERPKSIEGYTNAEWILMDYTDYVINIFSETARSFYDLERLWRDAGTVALTPEAL